MIEQVEDWTGNLNASQRARLDDFVSSHSGIYQQRLDERRRWQREAVALIKRHRAASDLAPALGSLFFEPESGRAEETIIVMRRWESDLARLVVELDSTLSGEQRGHVLRRLETFAADFRALAGVRRASSDDAAIRAPGS